MSRQARNRSRAARTARALAEQRVRRRNRRLAAAGGLIIIGLLAAIGIAVVNAVGTDDPPPDAAPTGQVVAPATATAGGALAVGTAAAPVKVQVYLDYMCPFCGRFERANGAEIDRLVADGTISLELHPLSFLDRMSQGSKYSTRTANAVATVADRAPEKLLAFHAALFARQPAEGSRGLADDEIAALAREAGVPPGVVDDFAARTFEPWVTKATAAAFDSGITGTPTVKIDGKVFDGDLYTVGPLTDAIASAKDR